MPTVRVRLTALYSGLFLLSGTLLVAVIYLWNEQRIGQTVLSGGEVTAPYPFRPPDSCAPFPAGSGGELPAPYPFQPQDARAPFPPVSGRGTAELPSEIQQAVATVKKAMLEQLLTTSAISLAVLVLLAVLLGWWVAGRILRPVHEITATARRLSWENLHERIGLTGPCDEFKQLADTFDDLLDRLHSAFSSQRRFIANASHELRTPLTIQRAAIQIGLAGDPSPERTATVSCQLLDANRRAERLIDGLLLLAQSDRGLTCREPVDLDRTAGEAVAQHEPAAREAGITVESELLPTTVLGDPVLLGHLVANLIQNAIRHNHPGGRVHIRTSPRTGLTVRNTGPHVPAEGLDELFEPFRRGTVARTGSGSAQGAGLGLSIVRSITKAHSGTVTARPNDDGGGLDVRVGFPRFSSSRE